MPVTNTLQEVVPITVERLIADEEHITSCENCFSDVVALSLTKLQPGYSSSNMGRILKRIDVEKAEEKTRIAVAVLASIEVVKGNPRC